MNIWQRLFKKSAVLQKTNPSKPPEPSLVCSHCQKNSVKYEGNICSTCLNELAEFLEKGNYSRPYPDLSSYFITHPASHAQYTDWSTYFAKHTIGHVQFFPIGGTCPSCQQKTPQYFWIDRDPISVWFHLCTKCNHLWGNED